MGRSLNSLKISDVTVTPIKVKYTSSYSCSTISNANISIYNGINGNISITGSISNDIINYYSIKHLYYSNYVDRTLPFPLSNYDNYLQLSLNNTGSFPESNYDNYLQSTAASGSYDADLRYFPTASNDTIRVISIPKEVYGENISKRSFSLRGNDYYIVDDGNGNLIDSSVGSYYNKLEYYQPEFTNWYVNPELNLSGIHIGNIIYSHGIIIITNKDYQNILPYAPIAIDDQATFYQQNQNKVVSILNNDIPKTGTFVNSSINLFGDDSSLFSVNNSNGTIKLNTSIPGIYTTYYTVQTIIPGGCYYTSNRAKVTVTVLQAVCGFNGGSAAYVGP